VLLPHLLWSVSKGVLKKVAHGGESLLSRLRDGKISLTAELTFVARAGFAEEILPLNQIGAEIIRRTSLLSAVQLIH